MKYEIIVASLRAGQPKPLGKAFRIDRGHSPLANPFKLRVDTPTERANCIADYRRHLWDLIKDRTEEEISAMDQSWREERQRILQAIDQIADAAEIGIVSLMCWCKDQGPDTRCHGDVVRSAVRRELDKRARKLVLTGLVDGRRGAQEQLNQP